jgi:hypothetical protein
MLGFILILITYVFTRVLSVNSLAYVLNVGIPVMFVIKYLVTGVL